MFLLHIATVRQLAEWEGRKNGNKSEDLPIPRVYSMLSGSKAEMAFSN
jgi:hypothetical protein